MKGRITMEFNENKNYIITACAIIFIFIMFFSAINSRDKTISNLEAEIQDLEYRIDMLENELGEIKGIAEEAKETSENNDYRISDLEDEINY